MKHGSLTAYAKHGGRCEPCRAAAARASKAWRRDHYLGIVKLVDAQPLKDHVAMLVRSFGRRVISASPPWSGVVLVDILALIGDVLIIKLREQLIDPVDGLL